MPTPNPRAKDVFLNAVEITDPGERAAFLDSACAGDAGLRFRVEALLAAHERPESLLDRAAVAPVEGDTLPHASATAPVEGPGSRVGPYLLLEPLGEGGMGTVFLAEQHEPVRRKVALKVIKPGMDSKQVIARFEAERQALALMDHPNIAKVLDADTTADGRPYFVMELVKGIPITRFCDEQRLTTRERLELAIPVCQAVQHAHQKGIIHRDLKPSNVLIALYDGKPVPKVIDFGVAKATGPRLTDQTLYTEFGAVVGTLEYMSPEQAEMNNLDIDTRSDIYALGVLLYELLTGTTPLTSRRVKEAALLEVLRVIREEEPPRPSTRLSQSAESLPTISAQRQTEPARLTKLVRGELDWIVMKALEKNRDRRYETANALAMDVQRYLTDEPVQACPPSRWYRLRKVARRHKGVLTAAAVVFLALVAGTAAATWQAVRATRAEGQAERLSIAALDALNDIVHRITHQKLATGSEGQKSQRELLRVASGRLLNVSRYLYITYRTRPMIMKIYIVLGDIYLELDNLKDARAFYESAEKYAETRAGGGPGDLAARRELAGLYEKLGDVCDALGDHPAALVNYEKGLADLEKLAGGGQGDPQARRELARLYEKLGDACHAVGKVAKTRDHYEKGLAVLEKLAGGGQGDPQARRDLVRLYERLGDVCDALGDHPAALVNYEKALPILEELAKADRGGREAQRDLVNILEKIASAYRSLGDQVQSEEYHRKASELRAASPKLD